MAGMKGLNSLLGKLDALGGNSNKALKVGITQAIKKVQGDAKGLAPVAYVDGGRLRDSIQEKVEQNGDIITAKVSTNVEYAHYVEFGTGQAGESSASPPKWDGELSYRQDWSGMQAQPYLYPALKQNEETAKKIVADHLKKEIRKVAES